LSRGSGLLSRLLSSEIKGQLLLLFHKNPGLIDTVDGVACRVGRMTNSIESDVEDLIDLGVLKIKRVGKSEVILLDDMRDQEFQRLIVEYLDRVSGKGTSCDAD